MKMKKTILSVLIGLLTMTVSCAQKQNSKDVKQVKNTITAFAKAADDSNSELLATYLDDNYRIVMNRLFGSETVSIVDKATYLSKVKSKEWGGDTRELTFDQVIINGNTAVAKVVMKGKKMSFTSLITLVKGTEDQWKLINETPVM